MNTENLTIKTITNAERFLSSNLQEGVITYPTIIDDTLFGVFDMGLIKLNISVDLSSESKLKLIPRSRFRELKTQIGLLNGFEKYGIGILPMTIPHLHYRELFYEDEELMEATVLNNVGLMSLIDFCRNISPIRHKFQMMRHPMFSKWLIEWNPKEIQDAINRANFNYDMMTIVKREFETIKKMVKRGEHGKVLLALN